MTKSFFNFPPKLIWLFRIFFRRFQPKWKTLTSVHNLSHLILWHIKFRDQFFEVRMMGGYINPSLWSITSSSQVFTNSESMKPDFFPYEICSLFWSVLNGFSFKNQKWYFVTKIVLTSVRKNCSSDWEKHWKFEAEGLVLAKF